MVEHVFRAKSEYNEAVKENFAERFSATPLPHQNAVRSLVNKFRERGSAHDAPRSGRPTILTEETVNVISEATSQTPTKSSMRRLSQEVSVSLGTAHAAVRKTLSLYPHRVVC